MKRWYVIQVYAGYEDLVRAEIMRRIGEAKLEEKFGQVLIPSAKMQKQLSAAEEQDHQLFPGYMLIEFEAVPEMVRLIATTPRVIRFLGGKDPVPLTAAEVGRIKAQMSGEIVVTTKKVSFEVGKEIEITDGPFAGFVGMIEKIDESSERLTVMVSIFGRMTPVELEFTQVKR